jgi:hypothetical protein
MRRSTFVSLGMFALASSLAVVACKRQEAAPPPPATPPPVQAPAPQAAPAVQPFRVTGVTVGNAVGPDKRVTNPPTTLATTDTISASVASDGSAEAVELKARWLYEDGQVVKEESIRIAPTGPAVTAFQIAKPDGWPTGSYKVEIQKDGTTTASQAFEVR